MTKSESIAKITAALAAAQAKFPQVTKDKTAKVPTKDGRSYSYSYADLASVLDAVRPVLSAAGIAVMQPVQADGPIVRVTTMLAHDGEWITEDLTLLARDASPQSVGSAITYARRYGLSSMIGIAPEEDDDAAAAQPSAPRGAEERWPSGGLPAANGQAPRAAGPGPISEAQGKAIWAIAKNKGVDERALRDLVGRVLKVPADSASTKALSKAQASEVIDRLQKWGEQEAPAATDDPTDVPF